MKYTSKSQNGILALISDLASYTGHTTVELREILKAEYWGEREGTFSLALDKCSPHDAEHFYLYILTLALDIGIEFGVWTDDP